MLNYEVPPKILSPYVPPGTELDFWNGKCFVSIVGFLFLNTRVLGLPIPFHRNFEEVNLRFYVRRNDNGEWKKAVTFIKELVPRPAIAWTARALYGENYISLPMSHQIEKSAHSPENITFASYSWRFEGNEHSASITTTGSPEALVDGSEEEFITEHYWGYSTTRSGQTIEYQVEHPRWRVWQTAAAALDCDAGKLYGEQFKDVLSRTPSSAFLADGSEIVVNKGVRIKP